MPPCVEVIVDWLSLPLSGATGHTVDPRIAWHGRAMALAWGILLPDGALAARFFKILPGQGWPRRLDNPLWWRAHLALQYLGVGLTAVGIGLDENLAAPVGGPRRSDRQRRDGHAGGALLGGEAHECHVSPPRPG